MGIDGATIFTITSNCQGIQLMDMNIIHIQTDATVRVIDDDVTSNNYPTICENWKVSTGGGTASVTWDTQAQTLFRRIRGDFSRSEHGGSVQI